jgi:hypothetical protein
MNLSALISALESFSLLAVAAVVGTKLFDTLCVRLINRRVFDRLWDKGKMEYKKSQTKFKKIKADYESSAYTQGDETITEATGRVEAAIENCRQVSKGNVEIDNVREVGDSESDYKIETTVQYLDHDPFVITFDIIPDSASMMDPDVQTTADAKLSSIGISIRFEFEFYELESVLMDLNNFADFLRTGLEQEFKIQEFTNSRLSVGSLKSDPSLDDWIQEQQFEVSLLLKADQEERSVKFHGGKAVLTSPYAQVDKKTADSIRATLLNYYL